MKRFPIAKMLVLCMGFGSLQSLSAAEYSRLWGQHGEEWRADSRLPDFSFAGYHCGERPLPEVEAVADVTDFGADGSDEVDDTDAFRHAIAETPRGAITIPAGRYILSDVIDVRKPGIVLRGAGPEKTILYFPRELEDVRPDMGATTGGEPTSNYSWSGGFLWIAGRDRGRRLALVSTPADRGDTGLDVEQVVACQPGDPIRIVLHDDAEKSLLQYLYWGDAGALDSLTDRRTGFVARVVKVDGKRIEFDRPLPFDVRLGWRPEVRTYLPDVSEVGIESLRCEFPNRPYRGHFSERGANAIALDRARDCWIKNVHIHNSDSGIFVTGQNCTVEGVMVTSEREPDSNLDTTGHHGIEVSGDDNLIQDFDLQSRFIHDLTVSHCHGNVFCDGRAKDLSLDHHKDAPYANLFTHLDAGAGTRLWFCGGGEARGRHTAAWATFWNIRADRPQAWPPLGFGPKSMNLVGLATDQPSVLVADGKWFEAIAPAQLEPKNLWRAQRDRRLAR